MKEELQSKLVEILTSIQTAAGKASDFAIEQLPDVAQSYIAYGRVWSTAMFVLCLLAVLASLKFWHWMVRNDDFDAFPVACCLTAIPSVVGLVFAHSAVLAWFAPKVWLLKELASLMK